ncbi:MAG: PSP1 C-terminal domain-containing protein [Planctomycetaceae bacterium]
MDYLYLIRYGLMHRVGRFLAETPGLKRGRTVVIRSHRGTELGTVLLEGTPSQGATSLPPQPGAARLLRAAGHEDLERARQAELERPRRFAICQQVFQDGVWPLELIDVEPLLDERRTVLHYLGPHHLDVEGLLAAFRSAHDLDVILEPAGKDLPEPQDFLTDTRHAQGCGHCGSVAGCGTRPGSSHVGCTDCGIKKLITNWQMGSRYSRLEK